MEYFIRLDDACERRDEINWGRIENLLDVYDIKPLVGIIPHCEDCTMGKYKTDDGFWNRVKNWQKKGWVIALHGYSHVFETCDPGINPVNDRSEFAGVPLERQKEKIRMGVKIFMEHGIEPAVFFAPAHTFDMNTLKALKEDSNIRIISDTVANKPYMRWGFTFIPQQSGRVRKLPFDTVTFCYHPNTMKNEDFEELENFIKTYRKRFRDYECIESERPYGLLDRILSGIYFARRKKGVSYQ